MSEKGEKNIIISLQRNYGAKPKPKPVLLDSLLRLLMVGLSLLSGPLQFARHLLGLLIIKVCPGCRVMEDYLAWLDNISVGDTRAAAYLMKKVGTDEVGGWPGQGGYGWSSQAFPNFNNQFEGV